jgi:acyl-CoA thioester hydrolase
MTSDADRGLTRADFDHVERVTTRWSDNDMYGHLNNAVYYELFDSAINGWVVTGAGVDVMALPELGVVAESGCRFHRELEYPRPLDVAVRVERLGRSSITYTLGLFDARSEEVAAVGHWVHVYIDRDSRSSVPIPSAVRALLEAAVQERGQQSGEESGQESGQVTGP